MAASNLVKYAPARTNAVADRFHVSLNRFLFEPLRTMHETPGKKLRTQLVRCLVDIFSGRETPKTNFVKEILSDIIEQLHIASLIIDDIEDESEERRGKPSLHRQLGVPLALNAGCWQLFAPFERIKAIGLGCEAELTIFRATQETILSAHEGQAVDLATDASEVSAQEIHDLWMQIAQRKTGALIELAAKLPFFVSLRETDRQAAAKFGNDFGVALQMFDDVSDYFSSDFISDDLKKRRMNWAHVCAADVLSAEDFQELNFILKNIEHRKPQFDRFVELHKIEHVSTKRAIEFLNSTFNQLKNTNLVRSDESWDELLALKDTLIHAYK